MVRKYRKRPVVIEAIEWTGNNAVEAMGFLGKSTPLISTEQGAVLIIHTLEGDHKANPGDFIIKGIKGEFYPCKPDIFAKTYEPVDE